jgi:parvulin-like peptidyl-prolyl isomerase
LGQQVLHVVQFAPSLLTNPQAQPYYGWYQDLQFPTSMGQRVLDEMIDTRLIAQYAAANGITVSEAEIDEQAFEYFGFEATPATPTITPSPTLTLTPLVSATPSSTPTVTPTATPEAITSTPAPTATITPSPFPTGLPTATPELATRRAEYEENSKAYYEAAAGVVGISQADLRQIFIEQALREKVRKAIAGEPPTQEEQINVRHILATSREEADDVLKALQTGASFSELARSTSKDTSTASGGGELGWNGKGQWVDTYGNDFEDALWNAAVGTVVGPIAVDNVKNPTARPGFHIAQVIAKQVRPLTPSEGETRLDQAFENWLKTERESKVQRSNDWIEHVPSDPTLADLGIPRPDQLQQQ